MNFPWSSKRWRWSYFVIYISSINVTYIASRLLLHISNQGSSLSLNPLSGDSNGFVTMGWLMTILHDLVTLTQGSHTHQTVIKRRGAYRLQIVLLDTVDIGIHFSSITLSEWPSWKENIGTWPIPLTNKICVYRTQEDLQGGPVAVPKVTGKSVFKYFSAFVWWNH